MSTNRRRGGYNSWDFPGSSILFGLIWALIIVSVLGVGTLFGAC